VTESTVNLSLYRVKPEPDFLRDQRPKLIECCVVFQVVDDKSPMSSAH